MISSVEKSPDAPPGAAAASARATSEESEEPRKEKKVEEEKAINELLSFAPTIPTTNSYSDILDRVFEKLLEYSSRKFVFGIDDQKNKLSVQEIQSEFTNTIRDCLDSMDSIKTWKQSPESQEFLITSYIVEVWSSEMDLGETNRLFGIAASATDYSNPKRRDHVKEGISEVFDRPLDWVEHSCTEILNLADACQYLFFSSARPEFAIETILHIHGILMKGLISEPGKIRTTLVGSGSKIYCPPAKVAQRLEKLIAFVQKNLPKTPNFQDRLVLASYFLVQFLEVHPFKDGNGRTGRLLFSMLMKDFSVVPISLFSPNLSFHPARDLYIRTLMHCQRDLFNVPVEIVHYCLMCAKSSISLAKCYEVD